MPAIFTSQVSGSATRVEPMGQGVNRAASTLIQFDGERTPVAFAITTSVETRERVSFQTRLSLRRVLYVYPFGDEPTEMTITLSLFTKDCNGELTDTFKSLMAFYKRIRLTTSPAEPITITIGGVAYRAYCVGMTMRSQQNNMQNMTGVTLQLLGWNQELVAS